MVLSDPTAYLYILGGLMSNLLLFAQYDDLTVEDFDLRISKVIFLALGDLQKQGYNTCDAQMVEAQIKTNSISSAYYESNGGYEYLIKCHEYGEPMAAQFDVYYKRIKKYALLRELKKKGYDVSYYYKERCDDPREEKVLLDHFEDASEVDILDRVEGVLNDIRSKYTAGGRTKKEAGYKIGELVESLKKMPDIGPNLEGEIFNTAVRGARPGCMYIKSASSNTGKTRTSVFDACRLAYPCRYSVKKQTFIVETDEQGQPLSGKKVLFIVTEMDAEEIQTIILAYLSKVNEASIIMGNYTAEEEQRVKFAVTIMEKYKDNFLIEAISDPNLVNISATIKRYVMLENIKYVAYDYIHTTPSLLNEFQASHIREDVALMLLSNQLKQLAKDLNIFIFTATQVNAEGMSQEPGFKNETCIRGAKSIIDKADCAYIMSRVNEKEQNALMAKIKGKLPLQKMPNFVLDVYKNRRGQYKNVRIWLYMDLGTGDREDICITTADNEILSTSFTTITQSIEMEIRNWRDKT